jgi:EmrB/QacA subfamily drug resistance transporter
MIVKAKDTPATGVSGGRWWALAALALSLLVIGLDTTVVVTALPTLSARLGASTSELQWVMDAYTLVLAGLILPAGVLGDRFGRRRLLLLGLLVFGVSSVAASQMSSAGSLIALRAVMGVGAAAIVPLSFSILPTLFTDQERPRAVAMLSATVFLGLPLGPLVAGWLLARFAWGSIFLINAPVVAVALIGAWSLIPESRDAHPSRLNWLGALLSVAGVTALVYGIVEQPMNGWGDGRVVAGLAAGTVLLGAFTAWQLRTRSPLVDLRLFRGARFSWSTAAYTVVGFALGGVLFMLAPFLQLVQGNDVQATGIRLLPMIAGIVAGALPSDRLTARLGTKVMIAAGLTVTAAGAMLLSRAGAGSGFAQIAAAEAALGLGVGLAMPPATDAILGALPPGRTGAGMGLTRTLQFVGMSLGVAVLGSILNSSYRSGLAGHLAGLPAGARAAAQSSVAGAAMVPHVFRAAQDAYATGMTDAMLVTAAALATGAVLAALFLPARSRAARTAGPAVSKHVQKATVLVKCGYTPATIIVKHGQPVRLRFDREETNPCSRTVTFGDLGISADLPPGRTTTVNLPSLPPGEYPFACRPGVLRGTVVAR